jgi:ubiquinone/menaquinone biosynthesis C-methylase UbiE
MHQVKGALISQFSHPRGPLGWIAGTIMAVKNRRRNELAVAMLDVQPGQKVLEIGFGPGVTIKLLAEMIGDGAVTGIDSSRVLVGQAKRRNAEAVRAERVALHWGSVEQLPFPDAMFDRILAVNSLHHWPNIEENLREVRRVLKAGGLLLIAEQPVWAAAGADDCRFAADLAAQIATAGFGQVEMSAHRMKPAPTIVVRASSPSS